MATEPQELREYQYTVNNMKTTALLTPAMAEALGATEVGSDASDRNGGYTSSKNQTVYAASDMSVGVTGDAAVKPVRPQQMGIDKKGRTRSMRHPEEIGAEAHPEPDEDDDEAGRSDEESRTEASPTPSVFSSDAGSKVRKARDK